MATQGRGVSQGPSRKQYNSEIQEASQKVLLPEVWAWLREQEQVGCIWKQEWEPITTLSAERTRRENSLMKTIFQLKVWNCGAGVTSCGSRQGRTQM